MLGVLARTCEERGAPSLTDRLIEISSWLSQDLGDVERELSHLAKQGDSLAEKSARHLLDRGGKRLRPICVALAARMGSGFNGHARTFATAVELVHNATLLHDDVVDLGDVRRGAPAARMIYGNAASIFGGDWLLIEALARIQAAGIPGVLERMLAVIREMVLAEAWQLDRRGRATATAREYFEIARGKTGSLFRWAMFAGARAGGASDEVSAALEEYGAHLGLAFQIVDDVLDLDGNGGEVGKSLLVDLREGKMTYPADRRHAEEPRADHACSRGICGAGEIAPPRARSRPRASPPSCARRAPRASPSSSRRRCAPRRSAASPGCRPAARATPSRASRSPPPRGGSEAPMIVTLTEKASPEQVKQKLIARGLWIADVLRDAAGNVRQLSIAPSSSAVTIDEIAAIEGVAFVTTPKSEHPLVDKQGPVVTVAGVTIGEGAPSFMCGPCSVESEEQVRRTAERLGALGVPFLRAAAPSSRAPRRTPSRATARSPSGGCARPPTSLECGL